jgi:8-oxo-dGTP diphosphatase
MTVTSTSRHLTASMVVIDPRSRTVLLVHHNATGLWLFPGGHLDPDETPAECAVREVREETGVHAVVFDDTGDTLPGMDWHPSPWITAEIPAPAKPERPGKPAEPAHSHIDLLFIGTADSQTPVTVALDEVAAVRWLKVDCLAGLPGLRAEVPAVARAALRRLDRAGVAP